jgi:hypothetical protein
LGLRSLIGGARWSEDYQGPYTTPAIGRYTGRYIFVECTTGFILVFLVKAKSKHSGKRYTSYCQPN